MDPAKTQQVWTQAAEKFFCGRCKAARLMIWTKGGKATLPHATMVADHWVVLHCDYFRRRIENPDQLAQCGAFQKREDKRDAGNGRRNDPPGA